MTDDEKVIVVLVDDDKDFADTRRETILKRFPEINVIHYRTGRELETKLRESPRPDVVIMDYDLSDAGDWKHGDTYTEELKNDYPDLVIIGCCAGDDATDLARREKAFMDAGADALVSKNDGVGALLAELEKWLPEEEEKWRTGLALATIVAMAALLWLGLLTVPGLVISFYTLPVGGAALFVFTVLYRFDRLPVEISAPAMGGALAMTTLGAIVYLAASDALAGLGLGGAVVAGLLTYLILTRR